MWRPSVIVLVAANLVPLAGVLLWDWRVFEVVLLYWAENLCIGAINVLKMIVANPDLSKVLGKFAEVAERGGGCVEEREGFPVGNIANSAETIEVVHHTAKLFLVPFFCVHYGIFCLVHGAFVVALLSGGGPFSGGGRIGQLSQEVFNGPFLLSVLVLGGSHLVSFFLNFLGRGEYRKTTLPQLMARPYGRIVVLHLAILGGAFATVLLGTPVVLLLLLIGGKILLDLKMHLLERKKMAN